MMRPGPLNLITDVPGILVGNAEDLDLRSGTTVLTSDKQFTAAVHVMGGAPGTRETDLLSPEKLVQKVDALVLSGGSALGLAAASGVADALRAAGRGFDVRGQIVPIVPAAIMIDLLNGGDKDWTENPYPRLGQQALVAAASMFDIGSAGAGTGATMVDLMGGLGSASIVLETGHTVGALAVVNPVGSAVIHGGPNFWAAPFEMDGEFGGLGPAVDFDPTKEPSVKGGIENTAIAIVATDADLTQAECKRIAVAAHDGIARAIYPSHALTDGDLVFAAATGARPVADPIFDAIQIGNAAAICLSRAIARGVYEAQGGILPSWKDRFG